MCGIRTAKHWTLYFCVGPGLRNLLLGKASATYSQSRFGRDVCHLEAISLDGVGSVWRYRNSKSSNGHSNKPRGF